MGKTAFKDLPEVREKLAATLIVIAEGSDLSAILDHFPIARSRKLRSRNNVGKVNEETVEEYQKAMLPELEGLLALAADDPKEGFSVVSISPEAIAPYSALAMSGNRTFLWRLT